MTGWAIRSCYAMYVIYNKRANFPKQVNEITVKIMQPKYKEYHTERREAWSDDHNTLVRINQTVRNEWGVAMMNRWAWLMNDEPVRDAGQRQYLNHFYENNRMYEVNYVSYERNRTENEGEKGEDIQDG